MIRNIEFKLKIWDLIENRIYEIFEIIKVNLDKKKFHEYLFSNLKDNKIIITWSTQYDEDIPTCDSIAIPFEYFSGEKDINEYIIETLKIK